MKRMMIGLVGVLAMPAFALAQTPDANEKNKAPPAAADSAVPEMKNPGGTDQLHPPQKAMDEATEAAPGKSDSSTGASTGEGGESKTWNANEAEKGASDLKK